MLHTCGGYHFTLRPKYKRLVNPRHVEWPSQAAGAAWSPLDGMGLLIHTGLPRRHPALTQGGSQGWFRLQRERLKFDKKEICRGGAGGGRWTVGWCGCEEAVRPFSERIHTGYTCYGYCARWGSRLPLCMCAYMCVQACRSVCELGWRKRIVTVRAIPTKQK